MGDEENNNAKNLNSKRMRLNGGGKGEERESESRNGGVRSRKGRDRRAACRGSNQWERDGERENEQREKAERMEGNAGGRDERVRS